MKYAKSILFLLVLILNTGIVFSQNLHTKNKKAAKYFNDAAVFYGNRDFNNAISMLELALEKDAEFIEALGLMGDIYSTVKEYEKAKPYYEKIVETDAEAFPKAHYYLGTIYYKLGEYEAAESNMKSFLNYGNTIPTMRERAIDIQQKSAWAAEAKKSPVPFNPINCGEEINSVFDEFHPSISLDLNTLIYTRLEPLGGNIESKSPRREDFYMSKKVDGNWQKSRNLGHPLNTPDNEGAQFLTYDSKWLFYTACNREDGVGSCDIYLAEKVGKNWTEGINLRKPINSAAWEAQPSFSSDGKTLYFSSTRKGGKGEADIWSAELLDDGTWGNLRNLPFNTEGREYSPFIHADGKTLFFASDGLDGFGGFDLFVVRINEDGSFTKPQNLGYPINTEKDEHGMIVESSGSYAYYASDRDGGFGGLDLYRFEIYPQIRPQSVNFASGKIIDKQSRKPLSAAFELIDYENGKTVFKSRSDKVDGTFMVPLKPGNEYAVNVNTKGYLFYSDRFQIPNEIVDPVAVLVELEKPLPGTSIVLNNIFFETGSHELQEKSKVELKKLEEFLLNNPKISVEIGGHTDNQGNPQSNMVLSQKRAKSVFDYLLNRGISPEKLSYKGYGQTWPSADNTTEIGRAKNRRTELKIIAL